MFLIGWMARLHPGSHPAGHFQFDVFISAGGGRFVPEGETKTDILLNDFCFNSGHKQLQFCLTWVLHLVTNRNLPPAAILNK